MAPLTSPAVAVKSRKDKSGAGQTDERRCWSSTTVKPRPHNPSQTVSAEVSNITAATDGQKRVLLIAQASSAQLKGSLAVATGT